MIGRPGWEGADRVLPAKTEVIRRIAAAWSQIDAIRVPYAPQTDARDGLLQAMYGAMEKDRGAACGVVTLIAPRGVGKTETIEAVLNEMRGTFGIEGQSASQAGPSLRVAMDTAGTVESVPSAILAALGDPHPNLGKPALRWLKAQAGLRDAGVRFIMLDEFNRAARRQTLSGPIGHAICEKIIDAGIASVALVGEDDASIALRRAPLLLERLDEELDLGPINWFRPGDDVIWREFVQAFDVEMHARKLIGSLTGFARPEIARDMCIAASGVVRRFVKMVRLALADAMSRGGDVITVNDLRTAVQSVAVGRGYIDVNPFGTAS